METQKNTRKILIIAAGSVITIILVIMGTILTMKTVIPQKTEQQSSNTTSTKETAAQKENLRDYDGAIKDYTALRDAARLNNDEAGTLDAEAKIKQLKTAKKSEEKALQQDKIDREKRAREAGAADLTE